MAQPGAGISMSGQGIAAAAAAFEQNQYIEALTILNGMLGESEEAAEVTLLLAKVLEKLGFTAEAAEAFEQAAQHAGSDAPVLLRRACELYFATGDDDRTQLIGIKLLKSLPNDPELAYILARSLLRTGDNALVDLVKNTLVESDDPDHLNLAGDIFASDDRNPVSLTLFRKIAALHPDDPYAQLKYLSVARDFCDYAAIEQIERWLAAEIAAGRMETLAGETGYSNLLHCGVERLNRLATNNPGVSQLPSPTASRQRKSRPHVWGDRLRIGYLSSDLWDDHATMRLFQSVLEAHDRDRFDVTLYCYTPERFIGFDGGNREKWGKIVQIQALSDAEAADAIKARQTDILVDLKGHTAGSRSKILNHMVAPVQVAWLGFPGSTVNIECDYVIGDAIVLPNSSKPHYHEKFCRLPETYQPNDPVYRARPPARSRADLGLPDDRFVLAAFNAARKVSLPTLDCWAEILRGTGNTVLWVMIDGDVARGNFLSAMKSRGVEADRIIFAPKTNYEAHIARLQAADLGLDTFPYNGHTTTSDQLWAGLPVLTVKGSNFASRVSESLLTAIGLRELAAPDFDTFVGQAIALSNDPERVAHLKQTIEANRYTAPLFDAERFCRHLETAYGMMADRARQKLAPEHFDVPAQPARTSPFR